MALDAERSAAASWRRDPFGERPLYYRAAAGAPRVGPSAWPLLDDPALPRALDRVAAAAAICGLPAPAERSFFAGLRMVPPGWELRWQPPRFSLSPYWEPPLEDPPVDRARPDDRLAAFSRLLRQAIQQRRPGPAAACLVSGGIDSGALLLLLCEQGGPIRAYTRQDDFSRDAGVGRARRLTARLGAEHAIVPIRELELPDLVPAAVCACETALANARAVASHVLYTRLRGAGETVILSGLGADEILLGNPVQLLGLPQARAAALDLGRRVLLPDAAARMVAPAPPPPGAPHPLVGLQDQLVRHELPETILPPESRAAAAEGIDLRLPYLDPELAGLCLRLPLALRARGRTGKLLLRQLVRAVLPDEIRARAKRSRLAPGGGGSARARRRWLALYDGWLTRDRLRDLEVVDPARVRQLLDDLGKLPVGDAQAARLDSLLLRLTSLAVLGERIRREPPP